MVPDDFVESQILNRIDEQIEQAVAQRFLRWDVDQQADIERPSLGVMREGRRAADSAIVVDPIET